MIVEGAAPRQTAQKPVVGGQILLLADAGIHDLAAAPHARVDDGHVDRLGREPNACLSEHNRSAANVLRSNRMADVDDPGLRILRQNDPLHRRHVRAGRAEIGGEGEEGHRLQATDDRTGKRASSG